ncbi:tetraacyldisaccharide 4'-kinase [Tundrisphaera sp. TA3]|uniref:tetraacyldisaccharide 4'-kinase n=1 Tax=Tundrisphaera sp. TA3 TaxID=3435775 RepID=UPI003EBEC2A0
MSRLDEAAFLRLVQGETRGLIAGASRLGLGILAGGYRIGVAGRGFAFDRGWKRTLRVGVPVVSVGNLTLGGTGKTPMVEWAARWFRARGARVAILSRGYGGTGGLNDEGRALEENLPDVPHLQSPDRVALARNAIEELESEVLILDDGFQHRRLGRDLDIVLLDALDPFGLGRMFPRGLLREPASALKRASLVVLSRADLVDEADRRRIRSRAERAAGPLRWIETRHAPIDLIDHEGRSEPLSTLAGKKVGAFCGIGNPEGFRRTLAGLSAEVVGFRPFPDHHPYTASDVAEIGRWLRSSGADLALTTQKDSVKLRAPTIGSVPLRALRIGLDVTEGSEILDAAFADLWNHRERIPHEFAGPG